MQKAYRAHVLHVKMTFIHLQSFLHILSYLTVASVISSMEFPKTFSEMKLLVMMTSSIVFCIVTFYCIPSCALEFAEFNFALTF